MQLKLQFQTLKKGRFSMTRYLTKKKGIMYSLSFTRYIMTEEDGVMSI